VASEPLNNAKNDEAVGERPRAIDQPVVDAVRAERLAIEAAGRRGRRDSLFACAVAALIAAGAVVVWWLFAPACVGAVHSLWTDQPRPLAAFGLLVMLTLPIAAFCWAAWHTWRTFRRRSVSARWTRGVPFDCPRCRYRLLGPTARCAECGWCARD
jgi:hypothetical protein